MPPPKADSATLRAPLKVSGPAAAGKPAFSSDGLSAIRGRSPRGPLLGAFRAAAVFPEPFAVSCDRSRAAALGKGSLRQVLARSPAGLRPPRLPLPSAAARLLWSQRRKDSGKRQHCDKAVCAQKTKTTGSGSWNPVSIFNPGLTAKTNAAMRQKGMQMKSFTITSDTNFRQRIDELDPFVCPHDELQALIDDAPDQYAQGFLSGVYAFRQQLSIITARPF
ncbi:hypothetical protein [Hydrogenophaga sp. 2FB]|uniref:hypothetical protein n=1 Tax=Hydrogenophaga sp. 2FB TaxID=2502187 RepID=UPI0010F9A201|nr:hypothetical protein [Hydrogenophaga sp. 2FB]